MISVLFRVAWTHLRRDRVAQLMTFVLPIGFFSIFAMVFGGASGGSTARVTALVVDESRTEASAGLLKALASEAGLRLVADAPPPGAGQKAARVPLTRARAEEMVRAGDAAVALVLPAGIDTSLFRYDGRGVKALLLTDPADPIAARMVGGLLQRAALTLSRQAAAEYGGGGAGAPTADDLMPARLETREVVGEKRTNPMIAFYAAGIAVMFLMFTASSAGGALIEETESGTLERVLSTRLGMGRLLAAKWLYITSLGIVQITVMFVWGMLVFRLPLLSHLTGFALMTVSTAGCVAAFGLVLGTLARTRAQLQGMANLIVLSLSAIGGSMFPRFLMSESLQRFSLIGFNAWALDGYRKVFWFELPVTSLAPQLGALAAFTLAFLFLARRLARRWETA